MPAESPPGQRDRAQFALLRCGFRPFFLLAAIWAIVPMATVLWALTDAGRPLDPAALFAWHGHEMLFGFAGAAVAGFLLTAVPTWTTTPPVTGPALLALVVAWLASRALSAPWTHEPSTVAAQLAATIFFLALAVGIAIPLLRTRNIRNLPFVGLLALLFGADFVFQELPGTGESALDGFRLALNTLTVLVVVIGGRIIPAFTRNKLAQLGRPVRIRAFAALDRLSVTAVVCVLITDLVAADGTLAGFVAAAAAAALAARAAMWQGWRTFDIPLLWVLHVGYAWIIAGLTLKAAWLLAGAGWAVHWMHALTVGAFGTMILGVMTRVALGHTGRPLIAPRSISVAYLLVTIAALLRVWGPWLAPGDYAEVLSASIIAWIAAFGIFLIVYTPVLTVPRVDGRPG